MAEALGELRARLGQPVDGASLAVFRIGFGAVMCLEAIGLLWPRDGGSLARQLWVDPLAHLSYPGLAFIRPWPSPFQQLELAAMGVAGLLLAVGIGARVAAAVVLLCWTHVWLIDAALYNNHHYLMSLLALIFVWVPADRVWALGRRSGDGRVPAWALWWPRLQLFCVYFFAGVAKLTPEWWRHAEPLRTQLSAPATRAAVEAWLPAPFAALTAELGFAHALSRGGLLLDLGVGFALLVPRTRLLALALLVGFHGANHFVLFDDIGWFPLLGIVSSAVFLPPDWPGRLWAWLRRPHFSAPDWGWSAVGAVGFGLAAAFVSAPVGAGVVFAAVLAAVAGVSVGWRFGERPGSRGPGPPLSRLGCAALAMWLVLQFTLPLRHVAIPGPVDWTGEGGRFAWRMKSHAKRAGGLRIRLADPGFAATRERTARGWPDGPFVLEEVDPFSLDWSAQPELVVLWNPVLGERIVMNPFSPASRSAGEIAASWHTAHGAAPALSPTLDQAALIAQLREAVPEPVWSALRAAMADQTAAASDTRRRIAAGRFRRALQGALRSDAGAARLRAVLRRAPPFFAETGWVAPGAFLVLEDPQRVHTLRGMSRLARSGRSGLGDRVLSRPHPADATVHPALPLVFVHRSTDGSEELRWNPRAELGSRAWRKLVTEPDLLQAYAVRIAERWRRETGRDVAVRAHARAALVPWAEQPIVDPFADLAASENVWLQPAAWIVPLVRRAE